MDGVGLAMAVVYNAVVMKRIPSFFIPHTPKLIDSLEGTTLTWPLFIT